jgi:hypothetical protein
MTHELSVVRSHHGGATTYKIVCMPHERVDVPPAAIARDIMTMVLFMRLGQVINIQIERPTNDGSSDPGFLWRCDGSHMPDGPSQAAEAIEDAYQTFYGNQTPRRVLSARVLWIAIGFTAALVLITIMDAIK